MKKRSSKAVSDIVGTAVLLGIAVVVCAVLYSIVLSSLTPQATPQVTIVATVIGDNITVEHRGGDDLSLDSNIILSTDQLNQMYRFTAREGLDTNSLIDGKWNIGEQFKHSLNNLPNYWYTNDSTEVEVMVVDPDTNTMVMMGILDIQPYTDLGITVTVDNLNPQPYSIIHLLITVTNYRGDLNNITGVQVHCKLPGELYYNTHEPSAYDYDNESGIWTIHTPLEKHQSITLTITATVLVDTRDPAQLAMILDGSSSISDSDWNLMKEGLARSIENSSIFPHDDSVELTVIQFGGTSPSARVEIGPTPVNNLNLQQVTNRIRSMSQMTYATPLGCGIRLATDQLYYIGNFDADNKRQIINLVTDGVANCNWIAGTYNGTYQGWDGWVRGEDQHHGGTYSAQSLSTSNRDGDFISNDLDATGASSITVDFWYRVDDTEAGDFYLLFYNGGAYNQIANLADATEDTWLQYTYTTTSSQYFTSNFRIQFKSSVGSGENVWIDDVRITTNTRELLDDGFEGDYWGEYWWNPGLKTAAESKDYLISTLQMTSDHDEVNTLAVGVGGFYGGPDVDWLKSKIVWPQPGHIAPPYTTGWVRTITSWQEFEEAISEIFEVQFFYILDTASIINLDVEDPNPSNNVATVRIRPQW